MRTLALVTIATALAASREPVSISHDPDGAGRLAAPIGELDAALQAAIDLAPADPRKARAKVGDAYFEIFEARGIEAAIAAVDGGEKARLEARFQELRAALAAGRPRPELEAIAADITASSRRLVATRGGSEAVSIFLQSFLILLREGFEAILVVGALATYLVKIGAPQHTRVIWAASLAALVASVLLAVALTVLLGGAGAPGEIVEGLTMLLAVGVLFYVSYWLLAHSQAGRWERFLKTRMAAALTTGSLGTLAFTSFLAVFREGAETILFYQALLASGGRHHVMSVIAGMGLAALCLTVIFAATRWLGLKLPLRPFFRITGAFLYALAFVFTGRAIVELQAGGLVSTTAAPAFPAVPSLGVFPYVEPLAAQGLLLLAAAAAAFVALRPRLTAAGPVAATLLFVLASAPAATAQTKAPFREYPIGDEQERHGMKIAAVYLPPVQMDGQEVLPEAGKERIHLECDIHAIKGNQNGFGIGEWIPYLTVAYELLHVDSGKSVRGELSAMVAKDGPHYGGTIKMLGTGSYRLRYDIQNPSSKGFGRHSDPVTGVADWFPPFSVSWDFAYTGAPTVELPKGGTR